MLGDASYDIFNCHSMNFLLAKHRRSLCLAMMQQDLRRFGAGLATS